MLPGWFLAHSTVYLKYVSLIHSPFRIYPTFVLYQLPVAFPLTLIHMPRAFHWPDLLHLLLFFCLQSNLCKQGYLSTSIFLQINTDVCIFLKSRSLFLYLLFMHIFVAVNNSQSPVNQITTVSFCVLSTKISAEFSAELVQKLVQNLIYLLVTFRKFEILAL